MCGTNEWDNTHEGNNQEQHVLKNERVEQNTQKRQQKQNVQKNQREEQQTRRQKQKKQYVQNELVERHAQRQQPETERAERMGGRTYKKNEKVEQHTHTQVGRNRTCKTKRWNNIHERNNTKAKRAEVRKGGTTCAKGSNQKQNVQNERVEQRTHKQKQKVCRISKGWNSIHNGNNKTKRAE